MNDDLKSHHICQIAVQLMKEKGFDEVNMVAIAQAAQISEAELFVHFGNKHDILLFIYQSINTDWQLQVNHITEEKLARRFEQALMIKIALLQPYVALLADMTGLLLNHSRVGVNAPRTVHIRAIGLQTMQQIVDGATNSSLIKKKIKQLPQLLYFMHWAALFLSIQTDDEQKTERVVKLMAKSLEKAEKLSLFLNLSPILGSVSALAQELSGTPVEINYSLVREIQKIIFNHRKTSDQTKACEDNSCETCMQMHEAKVNYFTQQNRPLHFILPAFPAKSPNPHKVLGSVPDLGEEIALNTLEDLCKEIKTVYDPGAHITICSDGRIFSELVGVTDAQVTTYVQGIHSMIERLGLQHVDIVNLEDLMEGDSFDALRDRLLTTYAEPLEQLKDKVKKSPEFNNLFNGIHRFITEDRKVIEPDKSATQIKNDSKTIALKVIQHSSAWTRFLTYVYPDAIRLSIHPYPAHSDKIGIRLTKATDNGLTPWHGVIVLQKDDYVLMKKEQAEQKGAQLVFKNEQPYYYTLTAEQ